MMNMKNGSQTDAEPTAFEITRRDLLKSSALLGGCSLLASQIPWARATAWGEGAVADGVADYLLADPENMIFSVCQQCNAQCGIKVKLLDGVAVKIDGNPLSPWTMWPHLDYADGPAELATVDGTLCPKGQAGIQSAYDPYRLVKVLKRAGPRGGNQWQVIDFESAVTEIVQGGKLFASVPGEEDREITGLDDIWALRDAKVAKEMEADVKAIWAEKDTDKKAALLAGFKEKHQANLNKLIDPDHPDLGPKNNQFAFMWGRLKGGRNDFILRFTREGLGSTNAHGHTTVCQGSLYFSGKAMSEQFVDGKFTAGEKFYWQGDIGNSEFIIFVGASPFEANYGPPGRVPKITTGLVDGRLKMAVIDPRLSKTAAKAWKWLPNKPGSEGAIAMALIRWVIDNDRFDARYLANANKGAARADGEPTWCNASWLVKLDGEGVPGAFLRAADLGLSTSAKRTNAEGKEVTVFLAGGKEYAFDPLVALVDGQPRLFDPNGEDDPLEGELLVDTRLGEIAVKSGFQLLKEAAEEHTVEEYADVAGLDPEDLVDLAREFTSHGKKAVADIHRGVSQHTNGFYNVIAWNSLNLLIGNYDWQGGSIRLSTYDVSGKKAAGPFDMATLTTTPMVPFGISIFRHDLKYEQTTIFEGYPAKRNWYPLASDIYQEQIPSMGDAYPYPIKALFIYMGTPVYALPGGQTNIEVLADPEKIPLVVASDIIIGETSMYADYIFPDLTYLERWEFAGSHPSIPFKVQPLRQPAIAPLVDTVTVYGRETPLSMEALILGCAEKLGLPNFGPDGFGPGVPLTHMEDVFLREVANLAFGEKEDGSDSVPEASDAEIAIFTAARKHLPASIFDADRWQQLLGPHWRRAVTVLNRGGRFQGFDKAYKDGKVVNTYGKLVNLYQEKTALMKNSMTGGHLVPHAAYIPAPLDFLGRPIDDEAEGYDLNLITYREISHTKSRTVADYWLLALRPENAIIINAKDAADRNLHDGESVRIVSATNTEGVWDLKNGQKVPMVGRLQVIQGLRPGVVAFSLGHGHFAYGANDVTIDHQVVPGDGRRRRGVHGNAAMRLDPHIQNMTLSDPVGGSVVFYDTRVKLVPEGAGA